MAIHRHPWLPPPAELTLPKGSVHVWRALLDQPPAHVQRLARTLSADEGVRAGRYRFEQDRSRFVVGRGVLRAILGRYVNAEPNELGLRYHPQGKPYLAQTLGDGRLCFNVAHSQGLALYAFTRDREIGIDLESLCSEVACEEIASQFLSPRENEALRALPAMARRQAFFACWTRKEAYIKARGEGLYHPLDRFDVSLAPGEPAKLLSVSGEPREASRWSLRELVPAPGYVAALAVKGSQCELSCWDWTT